jgi:hypothetical protein
MPYGTHTADDGDPYEWVADRFGSDLGLPGYGMNSPSDPEEDYSLERESVMHGDYAEEVREPHSVDGGMDNPLIQDEGVLGTLGGAAAGMALGGPVGAAIGAVGGQELTKGGSDIIEQGEETDEGWKGGVVGGAVGALAGPEGIPVGMAVGDKVGDWVSGNDKEEADECDDSPLKGQYGHSGKLKAVDKNLSFLDRLKELSGLSK